MNIRTWAMMHTCNHDSSNPNNEKRSSSHLYIKASKARIAMKTHAISMRVNVSSQPYLELCQLPKNPARLMASNS